MRRRQRRDRRRPIDTEELAGLSAAGDAGACAVSAAGSRPALCGIAHAVQLPRSGRPRLHPHGALESACLRWKAGRQGVTF